MITEAEAELRADVAERCGHDDEAATIRALCDQWRRAVRSMPPGVRARYDAEEAARERREGMS